MRSSTLDTPEFIGLKEFRLNSDKYIKAISTGRSFTVLRRSKPVFRLEPIEAEWDVDFRDDYRPNGISLEEFLGAAEKVLKTK